MTFGIVGAGLIGCLRAETVLARADCTLAAVADPNPAGARSAAGAGARIYADHRAMLQAHRLDAVICSAPAHLHEQIALDVLDAGCHLLIEKPLAPTSAAAWRLVAAAERAGKTLAVGFNHRYYPAFKYLRECLDNGVVGRIDHIRAFGGHDGLRNFRAEWMYRAEMSGGGAMMDVGLHMTDLCRFVAGEIHRVHARVSNHVWKVSGSEDQALALFEATDGVPILYEATWNEWTGYEVSLEVYGDKGMVRGAYAPMENVVVVHEEPGRPRRTTRKRYPSIVIREKLRGWQSTTRQTFQEELTDFLRRIGGRNGVPLATGRDGARAVEVAEACYRASAEERPVILGDPRGAVSST